MHRRTTALATLAVALLAAPAARADGTSERWSNPTPVVKPVDELRGDDADELLGEWVGQQLRLPLDANPLSGKTDLCLALGDEGRVIAPANGTGASTCTV